MHRVGRHQGKTAWWKSLALRNAARLTLLGQPEQKEKGGARGGGAPFQVRTTVTPPALPHTSQKVSCKAPIISKSPMAECMVDSPVKTTKFCLCPDQGSVYLFMQNSFSPSLRVTRVLTASALIKNLKEKSLYITAINSPL